MGGIWIHGPQIYQAVVLSGMDWAAYASSRKVLVAGFGSGTDMVVGSGSETDVVADSGFIAVVGSSAGSMACVGLI